MEDSGKRIYTRLELRIQKFVQDYGPDPLISIMDEYSRSISTKDYNLYHRIKKVVCKEYNIPIADISGESIMRTEGTLARKTISFLSYKHTNFGAKHIARLQNLTPRTIYNHVDEVGFWLKTPQHSYGGFMEKYKNIIKDLDYDSDT